LATSQNAISRIESPNYGKASLTTLVKLASFFDVGLIVRFAPLSEIANWTMGLSTTSVDVPNFASDPGFAEDSQTANFKVLLGARAKTEPPRGVIFIEPVKGGGRRQTMPTKVEVVFTDHSDVVCIPPGSETHAAPACDEQKNTDGYPLHSAYPNILWFARNRSDHRFIGVRRRADRVLHQPEEQLAPALGLSAIEPEREFVQIIG
jgi:hypothetical protein